MEKQSVRVWRDVGDVLFGFERKRIMKGSRGVGEIVCGPGTQNSLNLIKWSN